MYSDAHFSFLAIDNFYFSFFFPPWTGFKNKWQQRPRYRLTCGEHGSFSPSGWITSPLITLISQSSLAYFCLDIFLHIHLHSSFWEDLVSIQKDTRGEESSFSSFLGIELRGKIAHVLSSWNRRHINISPYYLEHMYNLLNLLIWLIGLKIHKKTLQQPPLYFGWNLTEITTGMNWLEIYKAMRLAWFKDIMFIQWSESSAFNRDCS